MKDSTKYLMRSLPPVNLEQLVIQRDVPVPVQAAFCEGLVERFAVSVFGVGERAVDVENNGFDSHVYKSIDE